MLGLAFWVLVTTLHPTNHWTHDHIWVFQIGETQADCERFRDHLPKTDRARCVPVFADQLDHHWFNPPSDFKGGTRNDEIRP